MTRIMQEVIERLRAVPEPQQERVAQFVMNELDEDERWANSTDSNLEKLERLTNQILAEDAAGNVRGSGPFRLTAD